MRYRNTRPASPKGRVFSAFQNEGRESAEALATELGVASKLERWIADWSDAAPVVEIVDGERKIRSALRKADGKVRYCYKSDPDKDECIIIQQGDEQSIVLWLSTGLEQCVSNTALVEV